MQIPLRRANAILAERYATVLEARGRNEAVQDIKEIVSLGMELVRERTKGRSLNDAQRLLVTAIQGGRSDLLVEEITADVQDLIKAREQKYLPEIATRHGRLSFLPDVQIPTDDAVQKRWQGFLDVLNPFSLRVEDPLTRLRGRIPFRGGVWLGDLVFTVGAPAIIIPDIREVEGNLMLRGHKPRLKHKIVLKGSLYASDDELRTEPSCIKALHGRIRIYSEQAKTLDALTVPGPNLLAWGARHGTLVYLNDRGTYRLLQEEGPHGPVLALVECLQGQELDLRSDRHVWKEDGWRPFHRKLPPELAYNLRRRFQHICAVLGLGEEFITKGRDVAHTVRGNIERIVALFDLFLGKHSNKAAQRIPKEAGRQAGEVREALLRLKALVLGEGPEYYRDMTDVGREVDATLDGIGDNKLAAIAKAINQHGTRIDRMGFKADSAYLRTLQEGELDFGTVLGTAGRAVVFVNNLCNSKPMRARAAASITDVRKELKKILGKPASQALLLDLLKFPDSGTMRGLFASRPDKRDEIGDLAEHLHCLNLIAPLELLRDFVAGPYKEVDPELDKDRGILRLTLSLGQGKLDEIFADPPPGRTSHFNHICRMALAVNMRSFLAEELKSMPQDAEIIRPSDLVTQILRKVERYRGVIPTFNRLCAEPESSTAEA